MLALQVQVHRVKNGTFGDLGELDDAIGSSRVAAVGVQAAYYLASA